MKARLLWAIAAITLLSALALNAQRAIILTQPSGADLRVGQRRMTLSGGAAATPLPTPVIEWAFNEGSGQQVLNQQGPLVASTNLMGVSNEISTDTMYGWTGGGGTFTNRFAADPDGNMTATRYAGNNVGDWIGKQWGQSFATWGPSTGTVTMSVWAKSNTGVSQTMKMWPYPDGPGGTQTAGMTVTTAWQRFSTSWTAVHGHDMYSIFFYPTAAYDILLANPEIVTGATPSPTFVSDYHWDTTLGTLGDVDLNDPAWAANAGLRFTALRQRLTGIGTQTLNHFTVYWVGKAEINPETSPEQGYEYVITDPWANSLFHLGLGGQDSFTFNGTTRQQRNDIITPNDGKWHVWTWLYDGTTMRYFCDEFEFEPTTASLSSITVKKMTVGEAVGDGQAYGYLGYLGYVRMFDTAQDSATRTLELADLRAKLNARSASPALATPTSSVVFAGTSITGGNGSTYDVGFPFKSVRASTKKPQGRRYWQGGASISTIAGFTVDTNLVVGSTNILVVEAGANDCCTQPTFVTALKAYVAARRAAGWKVIVATILPRSDVSNFNTFRNGVNTTIKSDSSWYDGLADIASDSNMGPDGASDNTTYYADGVHPTALGYTTLAAYYTTAINLLTP